MVFTYGLLITSLRIPFSVQSYGKDISQWQILKKSPHSYGGSIFINSLLSYLSDFAVLSTRKGKARREVKKNQSFIFCLIERASAQKKVKVMKATIYNLLEAINKLGYNNSQWGVCEDVNTSWYFGSPHNIELIGHHIYLYINDEDKEFITEMCNAVPTFVTEVENQTILIYKA